VEDAGGGALDDDGARGGVADRRPLREDVVAREDAIGEVDGEAVGDALEVQDQGVALDLVRRVLEDKVADALREAHLEARLGETQAAPAGVLDLGEPLARLEGVGLAGVRGLEVGVAEKPCAPVDELHLVLLLHAQDVGRALGLEDEELRVREIAYGRAGGGRGGDREGRGREQQRGGSEDRAGVHGDLLDSDRTTGTHRAARIAATLARNWDPRGRWPALRCWYPPRRRRLTKGSSRRRTAEEGQWQRGSRRGVGAFWVRPWRSQPPAWPSRGAARWQARRRRLTGA
jgi:hypothetical protein